jgi:Arylsulfotransferase (ASST)
LGAQTTRRRFLGAAVAGGALMVLGGTFGCGPSPRARAVASPARGKDPWAFRSRPEFRPPAVEVRTRMRGTAPGYVFVAPKKEPGASGPSQDAPLIVDDGGEPVWFHPLQGDDEKDAFNFEVQEYRGETVLTWWEGHHTGFGQGEYVIVDHSYREVRRFGAGNGYEGDHHEFLITPEDTALITIYHEVPMDLSPVGGPEDGTALDGIVQEIDIDTGEVLFEWHSLDHVALQESYWEPKADQVGAYDYFHINSVDVYDGDHLLVSGRRTSTVYKVDRASGEVVWRLGGKKGDFEMGRGARTDYQHDARYHSGGIITIFDNNRVDAGEQSRGVVIHIDEDAMRATLVREYAHPGKMFSDTQGNVQVLAGGDVFVGWGSEPFFSEFSRDGRLLFDARFAPELESYRAFRFPWKGHPHEEAPAIVAEPGKEDKVTLYISWNGATEVAIWEVLAGGGPDELKAVGSAPRKGFETALTLHTDESHVAVRATDGSGRVLGTSKTLKLGG